MIGINKSANNSAMNATDDMIEGGICHIETKNARHKTTLLSTHITRGKHILKYIYISTVITR